MPLGTCLLVLLGPLLAALIPLILPMAQNFEYEYATLNAYLALIFIPLLALWLPTHLTLAWRSGRLLLSLAINFLPGFLAFGLKLCPCAQGEMQSFWLLQTLPHLILAEAAAAWIETAQHQGYKRKHIVLFGTLLGLMFLLQWAAMLWFSPQKRSTHLVTGFIHGAIYDNWIPLDPGIAWARFSHALLGIGLWLLASSLTMRPKRFWAGLLLGLAAGALAWAKTFPSQSHGLEALSQLMPGRIEESGFTLHYQPISDQATLRQLEDVHLSLRFHIQDLSRLLAIEPPHVHVFIYPSREAKKLWFGGDGTDITDVITPSIHITLEDWPHSTLRHELVHALASGFAFHGLGFHPNMAFTEGLAVALAPSEDEISLHEGAANIIASKRIPKIENLFSPMFWGESGPRAYTLAGSMISYLIQQGGIEKVKALYAGESWETVFLASSKEMLESWQNFLKVSYPQAGKALAAEALYRYPGIMSEVCPHSKATLSKSAASFGLKMRQGPNWIPSRDYWNWRISLGPDPAAQVSLLRQEMQQWNGQSSLETLQKKLTGQLRHPPQIIEDLELFLIQIDLQILAGNTAQAYKELESWQLTLKELAVGDQLTRQFWVRFLLLKNVPYDEARPWLMLLLGSGQIPKALDHADTPWIIAYLELRNHKSLDRTETAWNALLTMPIPSDIPSTFLVEWWKLLGEGLFRRGMYHAAADALESAASQAKDGQKNFFKLAAAEARYWQPKPH